MKKGKKTQCTTKMKRKQKKMKEQQKKLNKDGEEDTVQNDPK